MGNEYPCGARSTVKKYIIEDRLANMSVESGEGILDVVVLFSTTQLFEFTHIEYHNVRSRVNGATNVDTLFLTAGE